MLHIALRVCAAAAAGLISVFAVFVSSKYSNINELILLSVFGLVFGQSSEIPPNAACLIIVHVMAVENLKDNHK
jgi:hypothetical protein